MTRISLTGWYVAELGVSTRVGERAWGCRIVKTRSRFDADVVDYWLALPWRDVLLPSLDGPDAGGNHV